MLRDVLVLRHVLVSVVVRMMRVPAGRCWYHLQRNTHRYRGVCGPAVLVDTQDEQIDLVEDNVDQVVAMTEEAGEELMTAERYQKSNRKCKLLFFAILVCVIALVVRLGTGSVVKTLK